MFGKPQHIILMSATSARIADSLQLNRDNTHYVKGEYIFSLENRPIYALTNLPRFNSSTREKVLPDYVETIDALIENYDDKTNMLIHSISYSNAKFIQENSKYSGGR